MKMNGVVTGFISARSGWSGAALFACLLAPAIPSALPAKQTQTSAQAAAPAAAQDIAGTWQGTLHIAAANRDLRIVTRISKGSDGALKVIFYSIDQSPQGIPAGKAAFENGSLKYSIDAANASYEGKMSADGKTIAGSFTQGAPIPLNFERATPDTEWPIPEPPKPMAADANPVFEVATIKPSQPDRPGQAFLWRGDRFTTINTTLMSIVCFAYDVQQKQVVGAPDWIGTEKFDIEGKPDTPGTPSREQMRSMVTKLLADRFQFKFHSDKRELSAYVLAPGKTGPKMTKDEANRNGLPGLFFSQLGDLHVANATMADFAHLMQSAVLDRPVVDRTGLAGKFDFELKWTPDESQFGSMGMRPPAPSNTPDSPPPLFTAIEEQLGLKLESQKAQVDVMVVDRIDRPSPN